MLLTRVLSILAVAGGAMLWARPARPSPALPPAPACDPDNGGLVLPDGFCALVVADQTGPIRHIAVAPNGDIFTGRSGREGGLMLFHDSDGDGKADVVRRIHEEVGTGVVLAPDAVYFAPNDKVLRFPWRYGSLEPAGPPDTIVQGLPANGHAAKTMALGPDGSLYVNIGSRTNSCQVADRQNRSPGNDPCVELETRAGIWRFDARRTHQTQADGRRVVTGVRNAMSLSIDPQGTLWSAVHGRDQLSANWGMTDEQNAENPAEEFGPMTQGLDYGWPYCYYDPRAGRKVLAPEYGGDGSTVGPCAAKAQPAVAFPAHWAPLASVFYTGTQFPAEYRGGAFLAFRGSWNRAPLPQAGYRVAFVPFKDGKVAGPSRTFARPAGEETSIRPAGLAVGPDGSLYIGGEVPGRIWRVMVKQ